MIRYDKHDKLECRIGTKAVTTLQEMTLNQIPGSLQGCEHCRQRTHLFPGHYYYNSYHYYFHFAITLVYFYSSVDQNRPDFWRSFQHWWLKYEKTPNQTFLENMFCPHPRA